LSTAYIVYSDRHHPDLPSFPTRRSSDLRPKGAASVRTGSLIYPLAGLLCCHNRYQLHQRSSEQRVAILPPSAGSELQKAGPLLRSEEHTSELQSRENLVCRLLLEKKKQN